MWKLVFGFLGSLMSGPLDRVLTTIDKRMDSETEREKARLTAVQSFVASQVEIINGPGRWLMLFFIAPLGFWFTAVCVYSVLFCRGCMYPQPWTVAALPAPIDEWAGAIITSLFVGGFAVQGARILKR